MHQLDEHMNEMALPSLRNNTQLTDFSQPMSWASHPTSLQSHQLESDTFSNPPLPHSTITEVGHLQPMMQSQSLTHPMGGHQSRPDQFYPTTSSASSAWSHPFNHPSSENSLYRLPTNGSSSSNLPGISLPPLRALDPNHVFSSSSSAQNMHIPQMHGLYSNSMYSAPIGLMSSVNGQYSGFGLPGADAKLFAGSRQKKEIKRRTKTGCLTCRKRRIKCDEQHPACRNCQKSKRECQGYEPLFKSSTNPQPIRPAPDSEYPQHDAFQSTNGLQTGTYELAQGNQLYTQLNGRGNSSSSTPTTLAPLKGLYDLEVKVDDQARSASDQRSAPSHADSDTAKAETFPASEGSTDGHGNPSTAASSLSGMREQASGVNTRNNQIEGKSTIMKQTIFGFDEVLNDPEALVMPFPYTYRRLQCDLDRSTMDSIKSHYIYHYATEIDRFLDTKWFHKRGLQHVMTDERICSAFVQVIGSHALASIDDQLRAECQIFWLLMSKAMSLAASKIHPSESEEAINEKDEEISDGLLVAAQRGTLIKLILSANSLEHNPVTQTTNDTQPGNASERELQFWTALGGCVSQGVDGQLALDQTRNRLDKKQKRDILYSVAVLRHFREHVSDTDTNEPRSDDETLLATRLRVAKAHLKSESAPQREIPSMNRCISYLGMIAWP